MTIRIDDRDIRRAMNALGRAFNADKTSRSIKRATSKRLRLIMRPMVEDRKARVLRLPSRGGSRQGGSMRAAVARKITGATRWSGRETGVSVIQRARGMPRDFQYAGRMFNREEGWNPKNLAGEDTTQTMRPAGWFDDVNPEHGALARDQIIEALEDVAGTMAGEIRRI